MTFDRELVALHITTSMFGKFSVHPWRECGGLSIEHSKSVHAGQSHCGSPRGAKLKLALNELK